MVAQGQFDTVRVFVSLLLLGIVGTVLFFLVDYAERLLLPWHISHRARSDRSVGQFANRSRTNFESRLVGAYSLFAIFGSSTSRNASPIRLTLKTVTARNTPGIKIKPGYS